MVENEIARTWRSRAGDLRGGVRAMIIGRDVGETRHLRRGNERGSRNMVPTEIRDRRLHPDTMEPTCRLSAYSIASVASPLILFGGLMDTRLLSVGQLVVAVSQRCQSCRRDC